MVLITTFNWIIVKVKCIWKYFLAYKFYRELYIHKSTITECFLFWNHRGKKSFLLFSKDLALTMKLEPVVRIVMKNVFQRKKSLSWEAWRLGFYLQLSHGHIIKLQANHLDFLVPRFLPCITQGALDDLSSFNSIILNGIHMFAWIYESPKAGIFQKII